MAEIEEDFFADMRDQGPGPGDGKKTAKSTTPAKTISKEDTDPWSEVKKDTGRFQGTTSMGEARQTRKDEYINYMPEGVYSDADIDARRAGAQSAGEQVALTLGNLVPNVITGLGESIGYLGALATEWGDDRDYTNALTKSMQDAKNPFGEVYRENPNEVWSMGDSAWWLQNFSSLAESAASFAIVGAGVGSVLGKGAAMVAQALKAEQLGFQIAKGAAQGLTAATLAYTEGAMSGYQVYQRTYDTHFDKGLAAGLAPEESDRIAKHVASQAAATTVQLNTAINTVLNVPQLQALFKSDDEVLNWVRAQGREATGLTDLASRLGKGMRNSSLTHMGVEALSEGTEEMVNQFAERTGYDVGAGKAKSGFVEQFGELSNFFDKTMNSEGALNFALGAFGGVAQGALLTRIPMHREIQRDAQGNALPVLNREGQIVDGKYQTKLISSHTRDENGRTQYYANVRDAVLKDVSWMQGKQQELVDAIKAKDTVKAQAVRDDLLSNHLSNAIGMGMTDAFKLEYQKIASADNTTMLSEPYTKQAQDLEVQKFQVIKDSGVQTYDELNAEQKAAWDALDIQQKEAIKTSEELEGQTPATRDGYAKNKDDNSYKQKAEQQVKNLETFQKMYDDIQKRFTGNESAEAANVANAILARKINNHLKGQNILTAEADLNAIIAEHQAQVQQLGITPESSVMESLLLDRQKNADGYNNLIKERKELEKARAEFNAEVKKNDGKLPADSRLGKMLGKYKMNGFDTNNLSSMNDAYKRLNTRLEELQDGFKTKATAAEDTISNTQAFEDWIRQNSGKGLYDFMGSITERRNRRKSAPADRADIRQATAAIEQAKTELQIALEQLNELESTKGVENFIKAVLKDIEKVAAQEDAKILAENKAMEKIIKDGVAAANLTTHQTTFLVDKNNKKISEIQQELDAERTLLKGYQNAVAAEKSEKGWKARLRNRLMTTEAEASRNHSLARIALLQDQIRVLTEQNEQLLSGTTNEVVNQPDVVVDETIVPEEAPVTEEVVVEEPVIVPDRVVFSDIVPDSVAKEFQDWIDTHPNGTTNLSLEDAYKQFGVITRAHGIQYTKEEEMSIISPTIQNLWITKVQAESDGVGHPEMETRVQFQTLLGTLDPDTADWAMSLLAPVLNGTANNPWNVLDGEVRDGNMSAETAAKLIQLADDIAKEESGLVTTEEFTENFTDVVIEDEQLDPFADTEEVAHIITPDGTDTAPEEGDQAEDLPVDLPEVETSEDIAVTALPETSPNDPVLLENSRFHEGRKIVDALSIANMTLGYEESTNGLNFTIETNTNEINQNTADEVLKVNGLKIGDRIRLVVDTDYRGPINNTSKAGTKEDDFDYYTDEDGKIVLNENIVGNVPIKIVHEKTGKTIGYVRRTDWVTARYPGAANYRNVADVVGTGDEQVTDNVVTQVNRLLSARNKIAKQFNANGGFVTTTISDRGPGVVMMNMEKDSTGKNKVTKQLATKGLPDTSLELGIASGSVIKVGKSSTFDGTVNLSDFTPYNNAVFAMLPMPNGTYSLGRLDNQFLGDKSRQFDITTATHALEVYLTQNEELAKQYEDATGFDILSDDGIRSFIRQHYTYLNSFNSAVLAANAPVLAGQSRKIDFLFNITNRVGTSTGEVAIGWSYSGKPKLVAKLGPDGKLNKEFVDAFKQGLANRHKNVVLTDLASGIRGLNSTDEINEVVWDAKGGKLKVRKVHANYNEYVKSFTETPVNGTNKLSNGEYVYSANPQNILDLNEIQRTLVDETVQAQPNAAVLEDNTDVQPAVEEVTGIEALTDAEREILLGGDGGFMNMKQTFAASQSAENIDGGQAVNLQNLTELHTFTPVNKRNGKTPTQVLYELSQKGITEIAPGYNPFYQC